MMSDDKIEFLLGIVWVKQPKNEKSVYSGTFCVSQGSAYVGVI